MPFYVDTCENEDESEEEEDEDEPGNLLEQVIFKEVKARKADLKKKGVSKLE